MLIAVTGVYAALVLWGFGVAVQQIFRGYRQPEKLLNPLFANRRAMMLFTIHIVVVSADLFLIGPWAVAHKSPLWYWGGRVALFTSAMPIAAYLNRNPQSFGRLIGVWVTIRNLFEYGLHVAVAALPVNWFSYYVLLWWLVAYRYLDVGPRRALQRLYNSPAKRSARPWAPILNWAVITALYIAALVVVWNQLVWFAQPPPASTPEHVAAAWEVAVVVGGNVAFVLIVWVCCRKYTDSLLNQPLPGLTVPATEVTRPTSPADKATATNETSTPPSRP